MGTPRSAQPRRTPPSTVEVTNAIEAALFLGVSMRVFANTSVKCDANCMKRSETAGSVTISSALSSRKKFGYRS